MFLLGEHMHMLLQKFFIFTPYSNSNDKQWEVGH